MRLLTHEDMQLLHKAVLSIDYDSIFAHHGYDFGALSGSFDGGQSDPTGQRGAVTLRGVE